MTSLTKTQSTAMVAYKPYIPLPHIPLINFSSTSRAYPQMHPQQMHILFLEKSFKIQIADYKHFHRKMGDIIVLVGTSTAGKTSIIKALRQLEPDRVEDGVDLRSDTDEADAEIVKCLKKHYPNEMTLLEECMEPLNIAKAIGTEERLWKLAVSKTKKRVAKESIQKLKTFLENSPKELENIVSILEYKLFDEAFENACRGQSLIFDVLNIDAFARHVVTRGFGGPLKVVLTYCPFYLLSSRMEKRNRDAVESGDLSNQRIGTDPLMQFSDLYSKKAPKQKTLEVISRNQAVKIFDENFDKGVAANRVRGVQPPEEEIRKTKAIERQKFLEQLGFEDGVDSIEIAPRNEHHYQFMLDSSKLHPTESAEILHVSPLFRGPFTRHLL